MLGYLLQGVHIFWPVKNQNMTGSVSLKTEVSLTQWKQILIVLQSHIFVQDLLSRVQELPLLPGEVYNYILEGHQCLQHETHLY